MIPSRRADVVVFRSGLLYEADLVADALAQAGIPHYRREETIGGPEFAMPAAPAQGVGVAFSIRVPPRAARAATKLVATLPVSNSSSPGPWGFKPTPEVETALRHQALFAVVGVALALLYAFYSIIRELMR
jgi:hypothetical protein